ncbi:hypothetical protein A1Q1_00382 [Trichosporon asahii var. asahii CBS 2479]|uniref:Uncharacterized protein n=1 Tax=Trichosporon asahii var. asahii (strain ATCC 90039 / CBS 2479 / JCM 2466 / KCTC 7840 / NBRC 103889/ NCYC 2677 / UAMH 7654) TaxID=1186058 RepID=J5TD75_TRIAS|nr:hypothetical protein A1Q1_00382 [Trichosporon asahii var. asahii CBS 2479]EJT50361.1 hypothetical protein A1Q1_00382 [Trichosporon asahii var. asahii CBS 2479]
MLLLLWKRALLLAAAGLLGLWSLFTATTSDSLHSLPALDRLSNLGKDKPRVAILEPTSYHSGVAGEWTELEQLLQEPEPARIEEVKPLLEANMFDVVIVNTCRSSLPHYTPPSRRRSRHQGGGKNCDRLVVHAASATPETFAPLISSYLESFSQLTPGDDKFWHNHDSIWAALGNSTARVLCTLHEGEYFGRDEVKAHLLPVRDRVSMLALGAHTAHLLRRQLQRWAKDEWEWEGVQVYDYAPVFTLPLSVRRKEPGNRDYEGLLSDLERSIMANPEDWGYVLSDGKLAPQDDAFTLHLVGMKEQDLQFPSALVDSGALKLHEGVDTLEYYRLIGQMDIIVPAFRNERYVTERASASIPAAVMAQTPLLATVPIVEAYTYLDPSAYLLRPMGMRPAEALRHLRLGQDPWVAAFGEAAAQSTHKAGKKWWSPSTVRRVQKDNERLFRKLLY